MKNGKEGAFACASDYGYQQGLTKREYFAAMAMQAMITREYPSSDFYQETALQCVHIADEMLKALETNPNQNGTETN